MLQNSEKDYWDGENQAYLKLDVSLRKKAQNRARALNAFSIILGLSFLLFPVVYEIQLLILLSLPWIVYYFVRSSDGQLRLFSFRESKFPGFSPTLLFAFWVVVVRAIMDYTILDYTNGWWLTLGIAPLLTWLFVRLIKKELSLNSTKKAGKFVLFGCFGLAFSLYTFFVVIMINCTFDNSSSYFTESTVISKTSNETRTMKHYYVEVQLPQVYGTTESVRMSIDRWNQINMGEKVEIEIRQGLLGLEWLEMYELN